MIWEVENLKHRAILMTVYSAGLRVSEVNRLKVSDINSDRMMIRVNEEKGFKDRYSLLGKRNLEVLRLYSLPWVVYCKPAFQNAEIVMDYLGRYTHRVAIANERLLKLKDGRVTFKYRDRSDNETVKLMTLDASEFIRRFLLHILPDGFMKIRHYGILSNRNRKTKLVLCKKLLGVQVQIEQAEKESWQNLLTRTTGVDPRVGPCCGKGKMVLKEILNPTVYPLPP